tara:strand:- start:194779 stop:194997 length:219 start_codon:yes stop_codon:yes gene_type:complete
MRFTCEFAKAFSGQIEIQSAQKVHFVISISKSFGGPDKFSFTPVRVIAFVGQISAHKEQELHMMAPFSFLIR